MRAEVREADRIARQTAAVLLVILMLNTTVTWYDTRPTRISSIGNTWGLSSIPAGDYDRFSRGNFSGVRLSKLNLSVSLNETASSVLGTLVLDFYNGDPVAFSSIPFHLYPSGMAYVSRPGKIDIHSVTTTDSPPQALVFDVSESQQLMWVNLPSAVQPGQHVSLNISFTTTLPDGGIDRAGAYGSDTDQTRIFTFASCYPVPCVYDEFEGWNTDPYIDVGDPFYYDMAFYNLSVNVPESMVVAATGYLGEGVSQEGRTQYHSLISLPVREVTFSASRYYVTESVIYHGVNVSVFYLPTSAPQWENISLLDGVQALDLFNGTYGLYPYPTLNIVEQHAAYAGMEYPCQVYVTRHVSERIASGQRAAWYLELVIAHEVAHQWWSQLVGDNCVDWGFLDEGLASWSHSYYAEHYYSSWEYFQVPPLLNQVRTFYAQYHSGSIINQSNLVRPQLTSYVDYTQMPVILEKLRRTIGDTAFLAGLSQFLKDKYFVIATLNDLQNAMESSFGEDLDWFFLPWFNNPYLPDYAIRNAMYDSMKSNLSFEIVDLNRGSNVYDYSQQVPVKVYDASADELVNAIVWVNGSTTIAFQTTGSPSEIRLDYGGYVIVQLLNAATDYYNAHQIEKPFPYVLLLGPAIVTAIIVIAVFAYCLRKRKTA